MKPLRLDRAAFQAGARDDLVLAQDVRDASGSIAFRKGSRLAQRDLDALASLAWDELHVLAIDRGDVEEGIAGVRIARAAAGPHVRVGGFSGGHWPLVAEERGVLGVNPEALAAVNAVEGLAVYTLLDGWVVDAGDTVGQAKIVPFVIPGDALERAEDAARAAGGLLAVRPFVPTTVGVIVQEALPPQALERFRAAIDAKVSWFGSRLRPVRVVAAQTDTLAAAMREALADDVGVLVVAGSRAMDPLDSAFEALASIGARLDRVGVPVHPGSLLWMARAGATPVVGMPSCGLFSKATAFDLVLPRLLAAAPVDDTWLSGLGHGGLLGRDMAYRVPRYQASRERGEVG